MTTELNDGTVAGMVGEILAVDSGMSGSEMDFIEDMDGRTEFSPKQAAWVEKIWQRVVGCGLGGVENVY